MKDLELNETSLFINSTTDENFVAISGFPYSYDSDSEMFLATFSGGNSFKSNHTYSFYVEFKGKLENDNKGFYKSSYFDGEIMRL